MAHPRNLSDLAGPIAKARAEQGDARGAVEAALDSMLANQAAVARLRRDIPEPPVGYDDEPELPPSFDDDEGDDDTGEWQHDDTLTERQQITAAHFEEYETDRMWGREDE